jgi:NADPH:quinone reductase-like Zn-dependent oxidoreductase
MVESAKNNLSVSSNGQEFSLIEGSIPIPGPGQALIRVHYSTVNPYDRICYLKEKSSQGFTLGCDGCGIVEAVGEGVDAAQWVGKKVAFLGGGWSRYTVKDVNFLVPFPDTFDLKQGANTYVNPFTATAMLDISQKNGAKSVILMAASSALAKMMIKLCQQNGITPVNIVRKDDQIKDLKENFGVEFVLNQESPTFFKDLDEIVAKTNPTVLFECVGGDLPGDILNHMPAKSIMVVYGNLTK